MVGNVVSNVAAMSQGERKFAQVERAAEELGIRLAELHDFLATSDGDAFMTQLSGVAGPQQISSGDDHTQEPLSQEPSSQENAHQEHAFEDSSSYESSSSEQSSQEASSEEGSSEENVEARPMTLTLLNTPPYEN
ncbi:uncharacterized protein FTJAE_31 [Fusarium tjaetaba]|uniref:Uncharacterized protein n=1 Tax=Fusarium tjaetaba TaxID=1567544 RepID=A0A8H5SJ17_9HYPO|nr:uncharacterized protein FTJAE_31 [Fusarium tjaetaba]KAF5651667.1 hypothetical protein FTJAE_31 [Fusarium tjaetaba]